MLSSHYFSRERCFALFMSENTVKQQILFYSLTRHPGPGYNMFSKSNESEIVENKI